MLGLFNSSACKTSASVPVANRLSFKSRNRNELRRVLNSDAYDASGNPITNASITPFRAANNAGDILGRKNYVCGGSNQLSNTKKRSGLVFRSGKATGCDDSNVDGASCNPTYVYDSSLYSKFKRQVALNKSYNDTSNGGSNNGHVSILKRTRS